MNKKEEGEEILCSFSKFTQMIFVLRNLFIP
jgi:hypothetical protein